MGPLTTRHLVSLPRLPQPPPRLKYYRRHFVSYHVFLRHSLGYNGRSPLPTSRAAGVTLSRPRVG